MPSMRDRHRRGEGPQLPRRPLAGRPARQGRPRGDQRGHLGRLQRGQRRVGRAAGPAQRQRAELLRTPARLRGLLRDPAPIDRRRGQDQPALPPSDLRQGRTVPADLEEVVAPSAPRRRSRRAADPARRVRRLLQPSSPSPRYRAAHTHRGMGGDTTGHQSRHRPAQPRHAGPMSSSTAAVSSTSAAIKSLWASNGTAASPVSTTTTATPPCSSTIASSEPSPSIPPAATNPSGRPRGGTRKSRVLPSPSGMPRDISVRHVARHNTCRRLRTRDTRARSSSARSRREAPHSAPSCTDRRTHIDGSALAVRQPPKAARTPLVRSADRSLEHRTRGSGVSSNVGDSHVPPRPRPPARWRCTNGVDPASDDCPSGSTCRITGRRSRSQAGLTADRYWHIFTTRSMESATPSGFTAWRS